MPATVQKRETSHATVRDPRWQRIVGRDIGADGLFWYGVATAANAIAVAIPCHRVVRSDGEPSGALGNRAQTSAH
jgi:6-O-methylguanine DNA methyltransferase, DNA binding domain